MSFMFTATGRHVKRTGRGCPAKTIRLFSCPGATPTFQQGATKGTERSEQPEKERVYRPARWRSLLFHAHRRSLGPPIPSMLRALRATMLTTSQQ
jgi:hypothetical protein